MAGILFEDIFDVKDIDPEGKKFDRGELSPGPLLPVPRPPLPPALAPVPHPRAGPSACCQPPERPASTGLPQPGCCAPHAPAGPVPCIPRPTVFSSLPVHTSVGCQVLASIPKPIRKRLGCQPGV